MRHQFIGFAILLGLGSFIWFAFRQGLSVKPDPNNRDNGPSVGGGYNIDGSHGVDGGHSSHSSGSF